MATRTFLRLVDDINGSEAEDVRTISFALERRSYSIELGDETRAMLEAALAPYVAVARRVAAPRRKRQAKSR